MRRRPNNLVKIIITVVVIILIFNFISSLFKKEETVENTGNYTNSFVENHNVTYESDISDNDVNYEVNNGVREKYTKLIGNGQDEVTVMIYMIGTDLESQYGMATKDINELLYGMKNNNINVVLQTGGCKKWRNNLFSNSTVERWYVTSENFSRLKDAGRVSMTDPDTLTDFINYAADNFKANRYILILWDHGGGSETGYGYDENYPNSGSLSPDLIANAIKKTNIKFDFIGFDACLMANLETAIAIEPYADYLIGSEETEPGEGWYYTNWINMLDENTSVSTLELGKKIVDDYISSSTSGEEVTQSVTDLGELVYNIKEPLLKFSNSTVNKLNGSDYQSVAIARSNTKEFSKQSRLDQVDLVDLASKIDVDGSKELIQAVKSAVKYNKTKNINNSYGLSIYFPYSSLYKVNSMIQIYDNINMEKEYSNAVKSFASYASSGQIVTQNAGSSSTSLFDVLLGDNYYYDDNYYSNGDYYDMFDNPYNYGYGYQNSFGSGYESWVEPSVVDFMSLFFRNNNNIINPKNLKIQNKNGQRVVSLPEEQWKLVDTITLNMFIDDGNGYLDLGKDNVFEFNQNGELIVDCDSTWLCVNDHVVSYQFVSDEYVDENNRKIVGYIPAYLNNQRVDLIVNFLNNEPDGIILGAKPIYEDSDIQQKGIIPINTGDEIKFICNYYGYDGTFIDEFQINDSYKVDKELKVYNINLDNDYVYAYCFKDIYGNNMWTPVSRVKK